MNAAEKALEGWTEEQWWQGASSNRDGSRVCILERLSRVTRPASCEEFQRACDAVYAVLREQYSFDSSGMGYWNDAPGRTFDEVRTVLEKAAVRLNEAI